MHRAIKFDKYCICVIFYSNKRNKKVNLMSISINSANIKKCFTNPMHLNNESTLHLAMSFIENNDILITPKVDGINSVCTYNNKYNLEVEKIGNELYIIDMIEPKLSRFKLYMNRLEYLSLLFNTKIIYSIKNYEDAVNILIKKDKILVCQNNDLKLYIKPFFKLNKSTEFDFFDQFQYDVYDCTYPNDGWICYTQMNGVSDTYYPIKLKPKNKLTVDLMYNNNKWHCDEQLLDICVYNINCVDLVNGNIYQLLASKNHHGDSIYSVMSHRNDKFKPNRFRTFNDVSTLALPNDCSIKHYIETVSTESNHIYYNKTRIDLQHKIKELLAFMKITSINNIKKLCGDSNLTNNSKVLDIGCGSCSVGYSLDPHIQYCGIDPDPYVLNKKFKPRDNIHKILGKFDQFTNYAMDKLYSPNIIIMNNSLYYFDANDLYCDLLSSIKFLTKDASTKIYILNIFSDNGSSFKHSDEFFVDSSHNDSWTFKYPWIGDTEFYQQITNSNLTKKCFNDEGWVLIEEKTMDCPENLKEFKSFIKLHKILVFEKT